MTCENAIAQLTEALMGAGAGVDDARAHLRVCEHCRAEWMEIQQLWAALGESPEPSPPMGAAVRFGRALQRRRSPLHWIGSRGLVAAGVAAAVLLATSVILNAPSGMIPSNVPLDPGFVLVIRGNPSIPGVSEEQLATEYGRWAQGTSNQVNLACSEELAPAAEWVRLASGPAGLQGEDPITGFFLLRAQDMEAAVARARLHPHVRYGGTIEVRPVLQR